MATIGRMSVIMDLVAKKFNKEVMGTQKKIARFAQKSRKAINSISFRRAALGAAALGYAVVRLTKHFLSASSQIEGYQIALSKTLGSMEEGNKLFNFMAKFAQTVTHEFKDLMGSAVTLSGIMKGGAAEVIKWIPLIADLGAFTKLLGIEMWETTSQIVRFFSAGAAAADLFREKGVLALLGFTAGVRYSVEETKRILMEAWVKPTSKFRGLAKDLATTWIGLMSMLKDAWFQARLEVMKGGLFEFLKKQVDAITDAIKQMSAEAKFLTLGKKLAEEVVHLKNTMQALAEVLLFSRRIFKLLTFPAAKAGEILAGASLEIEESMRKRWIYSPSLKGLRGGEREMKRAEIWRFVAMQLGAEKQINEVIGWRLKTLERMEIVEAGIARGARIRAERAAALVSPWKGLEGIRRRLHRGVVEGLQKARGAAKETLKEGVLYIAPMPEDARRDFEAIQNMIAKTEARWLSFADQVTWSWKNTMDEMVRGTIRFGDVAKRIFQDVLSSYLSMASQWAAGRMFRSTESFFRQFPGLGSVGEPATGPIGESGGWSTAGPSNVYVTVQGPSADRIVDIVNTNIRRKGVLRG